MTATEPRSLREQCWLKATSVGRRAAMVVGARTAVIRQPDGRLLRFHPVYMPDTIPLYSVAPPHNPTPGASV